MSPEETAGSVEIALGMWSAVGPSNHVLGGDADPPMVRGSFGGFPPPLKSIGIACSQVSSAITEPRTMHNFYDALPSMPTVDLQRGMDLWGDNVAFCQITLTSCLITQPKVKWF